MRVHVEFLGVSRLVTGMTERSFDLQEGASFRHLVRCLGGTCPALIGDVIQPALDDLQTPNRFFIKGSQFLKQDQMDSSLCDGDRIALMSLSAGG